ncbi:unnamed protein product [Rodentolepis nana]|uniref:Endo/exonuclease/phosphatase domain-containing protein n=1 Tax=Rodentolepis nana TaxID=102285 RepID=A0A0R3TYW0_RODNA|nr:unnamed protein product [Rodentolepis nana]
MEANISDDKLFTIMEANISDDKLNTTMEANISDDKLKCMEANISDDKLKWSYKDTNIAGMEIEDMVNSNPLVLIYSNKDSATYLHYNGTRTTPDLLLASSDISEHTRRKIIDDPGSGHKPVITSITIASKSMTRKVPTKLSWNFKKAD